MRKIRKIIDSYRQVKPLYTPPAYTDMMECYVQKINEKRLSKYLKLAFFQVAYLTCQGIIAHSLRDVNMFYFKNSLENRFGLDGVESLPDLIEFSTSYIKTDFTDLDDIGAKIVGRPRIRQVRLGENSLVNDEFRVLNLTNFWPYSIENNEMRNFTEGWTIQKNNTGHTVTINIHVINMINFENELIHRFIVNK